MILVRLFWRDLCRLGDDAIGVALLVSSPSLLGEVIAPIVVEVAVAMQRPQLEDGFSAFWEAAEVIVSWRRPGSAARAWGKPGRA